MLIVNAENISKIYPGKTCFENASFQIHSGMRIGFIGKNGTGKTSLFKILTADEEYSGNLIIPKDISILKLDQNPEFESGLTIREALLEHIAEIADIYTEITNIHHRLSEKDLKKEEQDTLLKKLEKLDHDFEIKNGHDIERQAIAILDGLGLPQSRLEEQVSNLSGGEKNRLALAILLNQNADLWLFDEPTNHLDINGIEFLEKFLTNSNKSFVVVSHDRRFLDKVTTHTWELEGHKISTYNSPFSISKMEKEARLKGELKAFEKQQEFLKKERDYIAKYGAGQRSKQAKGRSKRLDRVVELDNPEIKNRMLKLNLPTPPEYGNKILEVKNLTFGYDEKKLLENLSFEINPGETLAIVGPNGCGKSTLFKILNEKLQPSDGKIDWGSSIAKNHLEQDDTLDDSSNTPLEFMRAITSHIPEQQLRDTLAALMFSGDAMENDVNRLSGGERKKLLMTKLLFSKSNLLMLDEPTNHLDIESRQAIELALSAFEGTLLIISHDRYFIDKVADRVLWLENGYYRITSGGYTEAENAFKEYKSSITTASKESLHKKNKTKSVTAKTPYSKLAISELELQIIDCEETLDNLNGKFSDPEYYQNSEKVKSLKEQIETINTKLSFLDEEYNSRC